MFVNTILVIAVAVNSVLAYLTRLAGGKSFYRIIVCALLGTLSTNAIHAQSNNLCIASPEWGIFITDYGYADTMVDLREENGLNFKGREYLSGEWGNAIGYSKAGVITTPIWLEPDFRFPDWVTNSNFSVNTAIGTIGTNSHGLPIYQSVISNADLEITITSQVLDSGYQNGIIQGMTAADAFYKIEFPLTSGQFLFQQNYEYKNISGETLSDIKIFQLLHSLSGLVALYDDRIYPGEQTNAGPFNFDATHHHDSTLIGKDTDNGSFIDPSPCLSASTTLQAPAEGVFHYDRITLHTQVQPSHVENNYYGDQGIGDNHVIFKPSVGVHQSIEAGSLNDIAFFDPGDTDYINNPPFWPTFGETVVGDKWVATAQQHDLGSLNNGQSVSFTYLLSLKSDSYEAVPKFIVPIPTAALGGLFLLLTLCVVRLKQKQGRLSQKSWHQQA